MTKRNEAIDLLKGICILFVITTHFSWTEQERLYGGFAFWIEMAVPVFMLISGYVYTLSFVHKNIDSLDQALSIKVWIKSFWRYTIPFLVVYILEVVLNLILSATQIISILWYEYLSNLLIGGWGPGSYYYPVMIQFLFFFPFIYITIKKFEWKALAGWFIFNLFFEFIKFPFQISEATYRLLIFRYTFLIASGCFFAFLHNDEATGEKRSKSNRAIQYIFWAGVLIGCIFQIVTQYNIYKPYILNQWTSTCMISALIVIPFFNIFVYKFKKITKFLSPIGFMGKASYHIYFVQMVYYHYAAGVLLDLVNYRIIVFFLGLLLCIVLGIIFYIAESKLSQKIIRHFSVRYLNGTNNTRGAGDKESD